MKLDFGSGHRPAPGYLLCDITGLPQLDYFFDPDNYKIVEPCSGAPVPDNHFKIIRCNNVLHHVRRLDKLAEELRRVLVPGGKLVVMEPDASSYISNIILDTIWYRYVVPRPEIWFSKTYRNIAEYFKDFQVSARYTATKEFVICTKL